MSIAELMDAYDMELNVQSQLKEFWKRESAVPSLGFTEQIRTKVLRDFGSRIMARLTSSEPVAHQDNVDSDATLLHSNDHRMADTNDILDTDTVSVVSNSGDQAARPDDAEAEAEEWDRLMVEKFVPPNQSRPLVCHGTYHEASHTRLFDAMRNLLIRRYRRNVTRSLLKYLSHTYYPGKRRRVLVGHSLEVTVSKWATIFRKTAQAELFADKEVGRDAVRRAANSTWWDWDAGSTLYFWRWPKRVQRAVRDGTKLYIIRSKLPRYMKRQKWPTDPDQCKKLKLKLQKVRNRKYIQPGFVRSLTGYFPVPKAKTDI